VQHFAWAILALPFAGFIALALWQGASERVVSIIGAGSVLLAFLAALVVFAWLQGQPDTAVARHWTDLGWTWAVAGPFSLTFGVWIDTLSSTMTLIITGVGFLILLYSIGYMRADEGFRRFFAQMDLFIFAMLLLVLADNYVWLLIGWAGVGLTSYLLIGFYYQRPSAVAAARKAFVMNVIGDWGMMIGIFIMFGSLGVVNFSGVFSRVSTLPYNGTVVTVMALFLLIGAVAKSAQIPLYTWLPDAMEGPTPVSALIHAATMVTAGVYLIARSYPIYQDSPIALHVVVFIGAAGTLYAGTMGLANNDIKRVLAFSTMSQIAYMFTAVGVAVYSAGIFHLLEHAFFKALLFMGAGAVMHAMDDVLDIQLMGGLRRKMPFTYWTFLIGVLAIIGFPGFSGFFSKEDIIGAVYARAMAGDGWLWLAWALLVISAGVTAAYMFRLFFLVFHGEPRDQALYDHAHDPPLIMQVPMGILAVLAIIGGWLAVPGAYNLMDAWLAPTFDLFKTRGPAIVPQPFSLLSMLVTLAVTAAGFVVAWVIYLRRNPEPGWVGRTFAPVYQLFYHRYYVDELYDLAFVKPVVLGGRYGISFAERYVIDGTVNATAAVVGWSGAWMRRVQTGYVRNYALSILFGAIAVVAYYVIGGR